MLPTESSFIRHNIRHIKDALPDGVRLVAVSKYHPVGSIEAAYQEGQRIFGESHVQELARKQECLPHDIEWHFIGHLQTNKVKYIAPYISMIHAVDSFKLLKEINRQGERCGRVIDVLLELHIACEETKYGFTLDACREMLAAGEWRCLPNIRIRGLMMMTSFVDDEEQIRAEFNTSAKFFDEVKATYFPNDPHFCERSWGMSDDYSIAIECRSTMVRIGSAIFGERIY